LELLPSVKKTPRSKKEGARQHPSIIVNDTVMKHHLAAANNNNGDSNQQ